jgi:hypothetical protein
LGEEGDHEDFLSSFETGLEIVRTSGCGMNDRWLPSYANTDFWRSEELFLATQKIRDFEK